VTDWSDAIASFLSSDEDERRRMEKVRQSELLVVRYLESPQHEWVLKLARRLGTVPEYFVFTENNNTQLTATYDFYLSMAEWFQISFTLLEDGSVTLTIYDRDGHYYWEPNGVEDLIEHIAIAYRNPKTKESVVA
jgi:hypothetical protein